MFFYSLKYNAYVMVIGNVDLYDECWYVGSFDMSYEYLESEVIYYLNRYKELS